MACNQTRRCSALLVIQERKMRAPVRVLRALPILTGMPVIIVKEKHPKGWSGHEETGTRIAVGSVSGVTYSGKQSSSSSDCWMCISLMT